MATAACHRSGCVLLILTSQQLNRLPKTKFGGGRTGGSLVREGGDRAGFTASSEQRARPPPSRTPERRRSTSPSSAGGGESKRTVDAQKLNNP
ncbi:hypothetical protein Q31b_15020 [Novipirellula aureliae]|uniref:Uncharacterized protein n=1 Tax=Novipirellula aureliae TaxID=2527966 RepID=A0A5C6E4X4_9BACT|nr:hypothetical protein Q31b_15020 [Novipirellula aureliae]